MITQDVHIPGLDMQYIDIDYSSHMAKDQRLFFNLYSTYRNKVKLRNMMVVEAHGKGLVPIRIKQSTKFIIDMLFIPGLEQKLLTVINKITYI